MADTKTAAADAAPDVMPEVDDDIEIASAASPSSPATAERPTNQDYGPLPPSEFDVMREAGVQRYRELRDADAGDFIAGQNEHTDALLSARGGSPAEQAEPKVVLKVHGKQVEKPLSEVVATAQMNMAADERLAEAKRLAEEMRALHRQAHQPEQHHQPEPQHSSRREKLREIAERIQVGDTDEGADALAELIGDQVDVDRRVDERLEARQREREIAGAVNRFRDNFPAIINNPLLTQAAMTAAEEEIAKDLIGAGLPKELLDPWRGNRDALVKLHSHAHASGHKVRSPDALLHATGNRMVREFNLRSSNTGHDERRLAMKRSAPAQPRSAGVRSGMSSAPRPKTAADIVAYARRSRGFEPR